MEQSLNENSATKAWMTIISKFSSLDLNHEEACQDLKTHFDNTMDKVFWLQNLPQCNCDFTYYLDYALKVEDHKLLLAALNRVNTLNIKNIAF